MAALSKRKNFLSLEKTLMILKMGLLEHSFGLVKQRRLGEKPSQEWRALVRNVLRKEVIESLLRSWGMRAEGLNKLRMLVAEKELHTKQIVINSIRLKGKQATTKYILYLNDFLSLLIKRKSTRPSILFLKFDHPRIVRNNGRVASSFFTKINPPGEDPADRQLLFLLPPAQAAEQASKPPKTSSFSKVPSELPTGNARSRPKLVALQATGLRPDCDIKTSSTGSVVPSQYS
jgi:hypothetical protein